MSYQQAKSLASRMQGTRCAHLDERATNGEPHDRCNHPRGPIPMHDGCVAYESADASPGGQLTAEGLTMKPHIYRCAGVVLHQIQSFRVRMSWSPPAKGDLRLLTHIMQLRNWCEDGDRLAYFVCCRRRRHGGLLIC